MKRRPFTTDPVDTFRPYKEIASQMTKLLTMVTLLCASLKAQSQPVNQVLQWNKTLLAIIRTPGAQPATIHSTRSFAIMHAAIYDAVNAIDGTHTPYLIRLTWVSPTASQEAAASAASWDPCSPPACSAKSTASSPRSAMTSSLAQWSLAS